MSYETRGILAPALANVWGWTAVRLEEDGTLETTLEVRVQIARRGRESIKVPSGRSGGKTSGEIKDRILEISDESTLSCKEGWTGAIPTVAWLVECTLAKYRKMCP